MKPGVTLSSPDLRPSLLSIVQALVSAGQLDAYATSFLLDDRRITHRLLRKLVPPLRATHRQLPEVLRGRTHSLQWAELVRAFANRLSPRLGHRIWWRNETRFDREVARRFAGATRVLCAVEHAALESFRAHKKAGGTTVLRQVMAHADESDAVLRKALVRGDDTALRDRAWIVPDLERTRLRKLEEYALSDRILANSDFVRDSFVRCGVAADKVVAIPTGCPDVPEVTARPGTRQGVTRFLFVGGVGYRKGVDVLTEAWRSIQSQHAELVLAGGLVDQYIATAAQSAGIKVCGHLDATSLRDAYLSADVVVLPSRLEGLAHAVLEALSYGLPVIVTPETGAGRFVVHGQNGWCVPSEDAQALTDAMSEAMDHRQRLPAMGEASLGIARSWTRADATVAHIEFFQGLN